MVERNTVLVVRRTNLRLAENTSSQAVVNPLNDGSAPLARLEGLQLNTLVKGKNEHSLVIQ
jgi:hypothetical protein